MREILDPLPPEFTTIWGSDHLQQDGEPWIGEAWTRMTYLAAAFPRFRVGHLVLSQSYRNPALLAAMASTLQKLSGGRFILGLGAGWLEEEYRAYDFDYPSGGIRVDQLEEAIEIIRRMWTGTPATFDGRWYRVQDAVCEAPDPAIPILIGTNGSEGAQGDRAPRRLVELGWPVGAELSRALRATPDGLRGDRAAVRGDHPDREPVDLAARRPVDLRTDLHARLLPGPGLRHRRADAADVIREIELLVDHGVRHFQLALDSRDELRRFVDEVVPHVRLEPRTAA